MSCRQNYRLKFFDQLGNPLYDFDDYLEFTVERTKNEVGTLNIALPGSNYSIGDFKKDYRCEVWRNDTLVGDTCWFLQRVDKSLINMCETEFTLTFADSIDLLQRRVNAHFSSDGFICVGNVTATADDAMKIIFDFNYINTNIDAGGPPQYPVTINPNAGPPPAVLQAYTDIGTFAVPGRQMEITYEDYKSEAAVITTNSSFITVYEAFTQIADAAYVLEDAANIIEYYNNLWFDIVYTPRTTTALETFEFKTWVGLRGTDLRNVRYVGPNYGNLNDAVYTDDWSTRADVAFVAGDGDHSLQALGQATLPLPYNSYYYSLPFGPVEITTTYDTTSAVTGDEIDAEGVKALGQSLQSKSVTGKITNSENFSFINDFRFGDLLTLTWDDISEAIEVSSFTINVVGEEETIEVPLNIIDSL